MNTELKNILDLAITFEKESQLFYTGLIDTIENRSVHGLLKELADSEEEHGKRLQELESRLGSGEDGVLPRGGSMAEEGQGLASLLEPVELRPDSPFQDVLIHAMKREEKAHQFYLGMERLSEPGEARDLFHYLARQEREHRNIIERLYDDVVYREF